MATVDLAPPRGPSTLSLEPRSVVMRSSSPAIHWCMSEGGFRKWSGRKVLPQSRRLESSGIGGRQGRRAGWSYRSAGMGRSRQVAVVGRDFVHRVAAGIAGGGDSSRGGQKSRNLWREVWMTRRNKDQLQPVVRQVMRRASRG